MKLGDVVQIAIGVPDIAESAVFYEKLGFEKLAENELPWPWKQYSDGQNLWLLNQDGNRYIGLNYFSADAAEKVKAMEALGVPFMLKQEEDGRLQMAIFADSDGLMVGLINQPPLDMPLPAGEPLTHCGKFGEFALGVADFTAASHFWRQFGFAQLYASSDPYPWGIFSDGLMILGLHQTDEFQGPCPTYFAPDMPDRIEQLQEKGLTIENGILKAPGGETLFLFTGEI
jgi:catechol 2,3-dioxygenase-like lactoylglutathione lyase family enzyme/predicted enzyme related to lactoylglutathione lyase